MESNGSGRRRFLKQAAAFAGVAAGAGAEWAARGQSGGSSVRSEVQPNDAHIHGDDRRGVRRNINHITYFTPIQDYAGIITPALSTSCNCTPPTFRSSMRSNIASRSMAW
jgi:hypothetical protein